MIDRPLVPVNREVLNADVCYASPNPSTNLSPTTANMPTYASNYGSCHSNQVTQHHDLVSWGISPMWPDVHHSNSTVSTADNEPLYQWQIFSVSPSSGPLPPTTPPHLTAEYRFSPQPRGGNTQHLSEYPPTHHPYSPPPHSHPSSPLLPCKWLHDDTLQICGFQGTLEALKAHCKTHFSVGPPRAQIECRWDRCDYKKRSNSNVRSMRRDCMWRHMCEVHLGMKRA